MDFYPYIKPDWSITPLTANKDVVTYIANNALKMPLSSRFSYVDQAVAYPYDVFIGLLYSYDSELCLKVLHSD
jgi:hypothetical protein